MLKNRWFVFGLMALFLFSICFCMNDAQARGGGGSSGFSSSHSSSYTSTSNTSRTTSVTSPKTATVTPSTKVEPIKATTTSTGTGTGFVKPGPAVNTAAKIKEPAIAQRSGSTGFVKPPATKPSVDGVTTVKSPQAVAPRSGSIGFGKPSVSSVSPVVEQRSSWKNMSLIDKALAKTAKQSGTAYKTRNEAIGAFESKYRAMPSAERQRQFPTRFTAQPTVRPTYIPGYAVYNGSRVNVIYYNGGYGFWRGSMWYPYDPFMTGLLYDAIIMDNMMNHGNYYYGAIPSHTGTTAAIIILGAFAVVLVVIVVVKFR